MNLYRVRHKFSYDGAESFIDDVVNVLARDAEQAIAKTRAFVDEDPEMSDFGLLSVSLRAKVDIQ